MLEFGICLACLAVLPIYPPAVTLQTSSKLRSLRKSEGRKQWECLCIQSSTLMAMALILIHSEVCGTEWYGCVALMCGERGPCQIKNSAM